MDNDTKINVPAGPLSRALKAVTVAVSRDRTRPNLCCVQVTVAGGVLTLAATDSYRLHVATVGIDGDASDVKMLWPAGFAADVAKMCSARGDGLELATILVEGRTVTVAAFGATVGATVGAPLAVETFPSWQSLIDGCDERRVDADVVGFNPDFLAGIGRAARFLDKDTPVRLVAADALKPSLWTIAARGVTLKMLLMPVRV